MVVSWRAIMIRRTPMTTSGAGTDGWNELLRRTKSLVKGSVQQNVIFPAEHGRGSQQWLALARLHPLRIEHSPAPFPGSATRAKRRFLQARPPRPKLPQHVTNGLANGSNRAVREHAC